MVVYLQPRIRIRVPLRQILLTSSDGSRALALAAFCAIVVPDAADRGGGVRNAVTVFLPSDSTSTGGQDRHHRSPLRSCGWSAEMVAGSTQPPPRPRTWTIRGFL